MRDITAKTGYPLLVFILVQDDDFLRYIHLPLVNSKGYRIFVLVEDDEVELSGLLQVKKGPAVVEVVVTDVLDQLLFTNSEGGVGVCDG